MTYTKKLPDISPGFALVASLMMVLLYLILIAALSCVALVLVVGLGYLLSTWFTLTFFQGVIVSLGTAVLVVVFIWGYRLSGRLGEIDYSLTQLANNRIFVSDDDLDDEEDEEDEED